ncbi:MAG: ABC-F family ATP-binding cassette domain-containing protein [Eubacteriales bacterium]
MIKVENLSYGYPQKELYNNISFTLEADKHCAFIGISGSGKSSLVDMIMDPEEYMYTGKLDIAPDARIGYVSQFSQLNNSRELTVFEYIAEEFIKLQAEIDAICKELETTDEMELVLERYQEKLDAFEAIDGHDYESNINKKLQLADLIKQKDLLVTQISGGEFKLVQVIREMLIKPDLLIMDEPDVFLDFENLNSLCSLINSHKGTLLVITHNRYLLNHCFHKILHLEDTMIQEFDGNYIDYNFSLLVNKVELQELAVADTEEIERNDQIIEKLRARASYDADAARGRALGARVKIQERLMARRIKEPFIYVKQPRIELQTINPLDADSIAITVDDYTVSFDDLLLENVSFEIGANDKVAIIGPNGTGKTTLLRAIYQNQNPAISLNTGTKLAYLSQAQGEMLTETNTIFDEFFELGFQTYDQIRDYVSAYSFEGEILEQRIGSLSGGEKNILQLAKISTTDANALLLDEPTSHLDTYAQLSLEKAISNYNGAILMVSHDFYTIANCVDYVLIITDKTVRKMKLKKFKQMIYAKHFDKQYLELEEKKKALEMKIEETLLLNEFEKAQKLCDELEAVIAAISKLS